MIPLLLFIATLITGLFLGNFAYILINQLPFYSKNTLNRDILKTVNKDLHPLRYHNGKKELLSFFAHIPFIGYKFHRIPNVIRYELLVAAFSLTIVSILYSTGFPLVSSEVPLISILSGILWTVIVTMWLVTFIVDLRHYIIPDKVNFILFISSLLLIVMGSFDNGSILWANLITGFGIFALFFLLGVISGGMGGGDTKFIISSGFIFGPQVIFVILFSSLMGAFYRIVLVPVLKLNDGKESPEDIKGKKVFPYGPFLVISSYLVLFFTPFFVTLINSYIEYVIG